jgi:RNA polymerase sigma-70 factor (ECF subfamily)
VHGAGTTSSDDRAWFRATRWSLIRSAGNGVNAESRAALAEMCQVYWYPLYVFTRRRGFGSEAAADLIQSFFVELLQGSLLRAADPDKGRFRSYLLGALKHSISRERVRASAQKRGGGASPVSLEGAETRYATEPSDDVTPEQVFERRWAIALLDRVLVLLRGEYVRAGKGLLFEQLKDLLAGPLPERSYADVGRELDMSEGAMKVAVHRLRHRYRELLLAQVADTVATADEVEDEVAQLYRALGAG